MTRQEAAKHFRRRLSQRGIKAHCRATRSCKVDYIRISTATFEARFSEDEQKEILSIAYACHLLHADRSEIDISRVGGFSAGASFILPRGDARTQTILESWSPCMECRERAAVQGEEYCPDCRDNLAEAAWERQQEGEPPLTMDEMHRAAWDEKQRLR